jgi:uncharacterized protein (TIGR00299 family) protein
MKTLYLDCGMGAAGDMLAAALLELLPDQDAFLAKINSLGIPGVRVNKEPSVKCGISGTHFCVTVDGEEEDIPGLQAHGHEHHEHGHDHTHTRAGKNIHHPHNSLREIEALIEGLSLPQKVREDILAVYMRIAEAESHVHGVPVAQIHFHEVGAMDAVADIAAVCMLLDEIAPQRVIASPIHVGGGHIRCAHGILPVPAPATAHILRDVPIYGGGIKGELCTPTGAALLKHFAAEFGDMPVMKVQAIGYGMGKKDFEAANCVRALLGETRGGGDTVSELRCNIDDMTPEAVGFAMERLIEAGALDVYTVPVGMKKSRPGVLLCVICRESEKDRMVSLILKHTSTLGVRENISARYTLQRTTSVVDTPYGPVRQKRSEGYGVSKTKYEFDDLARIAKEKNLSIADVIRLIEKG